MKRIIVYANKLAHESKSKDIKWLHISESINKILLSNYVGEELIDYCRAYKFEFPNKAGIEINVETLRELELLPMKSFDEDADDFIYYMSKKGVYINEDKLGVKSIGEALIIDAKRMRKELQNKIFGQESAIEAVTDTIKNNIFDTYESPKATFLFLGPPATGKTYLSKLICENLSGYNWKRFDMTQFSREGSGARLYGTDRQYNSTMPGELTSFVRENPKSIIVLDEFEKAHSVIQSNLLSIFEGAKLNDVCGWSKINGNPYHNDNNKCEIEDSEFEVLFNEVIFVITSNLGKELYSDSKFLKLINENHLEAESMILDSLKRENKLEEGKEVSSIRPELLSRFSKGSIVLFNKLNFFGIKSIADRVFKKYQEEFKNKFKISFNAGRNFDDFIITQILSFSPEIDVRRIQSKIGVNFFDIITDYFMDLDENINCSKIKISFSQQAKDFIKNFIKGREEELLKELFRKNLTLNVDEKLTLNENVFTYTINNLEFKRVNRVKDFSEDGLVFDIPKDTFCDIAGHAKVKNRLLEVATFLKNPDKLKRFNVNAPKGMLLYGPPGTGKTKLARALANEAGLPYIATTGSDLRNIIYDKESGKSEYLIKKIFTKAKEYAPSIIFIDEIDAIGNRENGGNIDVINKLLSEMDGFSNDPTENIFVIAATNHKENIDDAIIRPGRIELHVEVNQLDKNARRFFIERIINSRPSKGKFDLDKLVMYTTNMSGATLELLEREASLYCVRHEIDYLTEDILIEQINILNYGEKIPREVIENSLCHTAIHEAGHAVLSKILMPHLNIEQITITARGKSLGFVSFGEQDISNNKTIEDFQNDICVCFAGRIAQIKKFGKIDGTDTGASSDLNSATLKAYNAIAYYGMDEKIGYINIHGLSPTIREHFDREISISVQEWLKNAEKRTVDLVDKYWNIIERLSEVLLEKEVVSESELLEIINQNKDYNE